MRYCRSLCVSTNIGGSSVRAIQKSAAVRVGGVCMLALLGHVLSHLHFLLFHEDLKQANLSLQELTGITTPTFL